VSGITYSGTGVNSAGLFTPPSTPGTYTITASLNGKTVRSDIITVHPADYMRKPYTNVAAGRTYYGYQGAYETKSVNSNISLTYPAGNNITADGFVTVEGESKGNYALYIYKSGDDSLVTSCSIPTGKFSVRVWMRFGPGLYRVVFSNLTQNLFTVTNTNTDKGADGGDPRFLYPSTVVQSDDFRITNILSDILYGVNREADKIKKIHDYLVQNTVYDLDVYNKVINGTYNSYTDREQTALNVLGTRYHIDPQYEPLGHYLAVCDGYSNATAALLRAAGIETRIVTSATMNHAWNNVFTGGSWKFLDVTWDDPVPGELLQTYSDNFYDNGPAYVSYTYYLLTTMDGVGGDHPGGVADATRGINSVPALPKMRGMPDGWY